MQKNGCKPGHIQWGTLCIKNEFPAIGTNIAPSVENMTGCERVGAYWNENYDVCVYSDDYKGTVGWTAPIKGAYVKWERGPHAIFSKLYDAYGKLKGGIDEKALVEIGKEVNKYTEIIACPVYADPFYVGSHLQAIGGCKKPIYQKTMHTDDARKIGLTLASDIAHGQARRHGLYYFNHKGIHVQFSDKHAIVSDEPKKIVELYKDSNLDQQAPFSIRAGLGR